MTISPLGHSIHAGTCQVKSLSALQYASYLSLLVLKICNSNFASIAYVQTANLNSSIEGNLASNFSSGLSL
jgi:hypothetical protein